MVEEAIQFAQSVTHAPLENRRLRDVPVTSMEHVPAVFDGVQPVRTSVDLPIDRSCEREKVLFEELFISDQAKALMYAFFAERAASKWQMPSGENSTNTKPLPVKTTAVIGAGTMGSGIAVSLLTAGFSVILLEQDKKFLDRGMQTIRSILASSVRAKRLTSDGMTKCLSLLTPADSIDHLRQVDLVIEAVFENLDLKKEIFAKLDTICKNDAILCTNTSTFDIDKIASVTTRPDKVVGTHFFAPAHIMRLLENVYGSKTSGTTVATVMQLGKTMGKVPVLVGTCYGFVANRMLLKHWSETMFLVEDGALPHEVDQALEEFGMAMGSFRVRDISGLDVSHRILQERAKAKGLVLTVDTRYFDGERYSSVWHKLYNLQRLGQKTGKGWYRYDKPGGRVATVDEEVTQLILDHSAKLGIVRRQIPAQEIVERSLFAVINEAFHCLEDGVAAKPEDIDVIWLHGLGFPRDRGGPLFYAGQIGLKNVFDRIRFYHKQFPDVAHWMPSELLRRLALAENTVPMSSWNLKASSKL